MPPASLSTLAVMKPGPTTAKNSRMRVFQRLRNLMRAFRRHRDGTVARATTEQNKRSERMGQQKKAESNRFEPWSSAGTGEDPTESYSFLRASASADEVSCRICLSCGKEPASAANVSFLAESAASLVAFASRPMWGLALQ